MIFLLDNTQKILELLTIFGLVFAGSRWFYIKIFYPNYTKLNLFFKDVSQINKKVNEIETKVNRINVEFQPNGGGSMKDVLNKIRDKMLTYDERQKIILNETSFAVFETDSDGNFLYVNKTFTDWLFCRDYELLGNEWLNFVYTDDRKRITEEWEECKKYKKTFVSKFKFVTNQNELLYISLKSTMIKSLHGDHVIGWMGIIQNLSDMESFNI